MNTTFLTQPGIRGWWIGLRTNLLKCIGTTGTAWLGSNGLSASGIPGTHGLGLDWRQAAGLFAVHILAEIFAYLKANPNPEAGNSTPTPPANPPALP